MVIAIQLCSLLGEKVLWNNWNSEYTSNACLSCKNILVEDFLTSNGITTTTNEEVKEPLPPQQWDDISLVVVQLDACNHYYQLIVKNNLISFWNAMFLYSCVVLASMVHFGNILATCCVPGLLTHMWLEELTCEWSWRPFVWLRSCVWWRWNCCGCEIRSTPE